MDAPTRPPLRGPVVASFSLEPSEIHLLEGALGSIRPLALDAAGELVLGAPVHWTSDVSGIVGLGDSTESGSPELILAQHAGVAVITAEISHQRAVARVAVLPAVAVEDVVAGTGHLCVLTADAAAYCWGSNYVGELGHSLSTCPGSEYNTCVTSPLPVDGGVRFVDLTAGVFGGYGTGGFGGGEHACGVSEDGSGYCWGSDRNGQLGDGADGDDRQPFPSRVVGGLTLRAIRVGGRHTCALTTAGAAYCWGANDHGQLGDRTGTTCSLYPMACSARPVPVSGGLRFTSIAVGYDHACGLAADSAAYCWGDNVVGELGIATADTIAHYTPLPVVGGLRFVALSLSGGHSCGLTGGGQAYCWGTNLWGRVTTEGANEPCAVPIYMTETELCRLSPTPVAGAPLLKALSGRCGIALDGVVYCWGGFGVEPQGGNSSLGSLEPLIKQPFPVSRQLRFVTLTEESELCGIATDGLAYCVVAVLQRDSGFSDFGPFERIPGQR